MSRPIFPPARDSLYQFSDFSPVKHKLPMKQHLVQKAPPGPAIQQVRSELSHIDRSTVSGRYNPSRFAFHVPQSMDFDLQRLADRAAIAETAQREAQARLIKHSASLPVFRSLPPACEAPNTEARAPEVAPALTIDIQSHLPPWAREEPLPPSPPPRRISTREKTWRDQLVAADEGRGPDPLAIHVLRKHGHRFRPGGLADQINLSGSLSTFAISNARLCSVQNGFPVVNKLHIPKY